MDRNYLTKVKEQYEALPYPPRNPLDEKKNLWVVDFDFLGKISHFCFAGNADFKNGFRILVAGGGTGDSAIFLAEQLRGINAKIIYIDLSQSSMEIAKLRAKQRGLDNIEWHILSILDLPNQNFDKFDYITCSGVLHHLADPVKGLKSLNVCLKESGCMGIMVYGQYGRTSVYHTQQLLRMINTSDTSMADKIKNARQIIKSLPKTNWLKNGPFILNDVNNLSDSDLYDLFLHTQDRAYTVPELYQWLADCDLNMIDFACNKILYQPDNYITDKDLLSKIKSLPLPTQQAIAENMTGSLNTHVFYAAKKRHTMALISDIENIPYFCDTLPLDNLQLYDHVKQMRPESDVSLTFPNTKISVNLNLGRFGKYFFKYINGNLSIKKIIQKVSTEEEIILMKPLKNDIEQELKIFYNQFHRHNLILLKKNGGFRFKTYFEMQNRDFG